MGQVRSDYTEVMVLPTLDYTGVEPGRVIEVADEDVYHWVAGGFTPLTRYPVPHRLYPNHRHDPLAYALPEPDEDDPSAIAVGAPRDAAPPAPVPAPQPVPPVPAATAPAAAPPTAAPDAPAAGSAKE